MKMTNMLIAAFAMIVSAQAMAEVPAPGSSVLHDYNCSVPRSADGAMILGAGYSLIVATAALAPQYNITGCSLSMRVVAPNAKPNEIPVGPVSQTASVAIFGNDSITIVIRKSDFSAQILFANGATSNCTIKN